MSGKKTKIADDGFRRLLSNHSCDCNNKNCRTLLQQYYENEDSIYPNNKKQLLFMISNPSKSTGKQASRQKRQQQIYDRAAFLLNVDNPHEKDLIYVAITHYSPIVINYYNADKSSSKEKNFAEYLLPHDLIKTLEVKFTRVDKFNCIGTTKALEKKKCTNNGVILCFDGINNSF